MKKYLSLTALLVLALFMMVSCATKALSEPVVVEEAKTLDSSVKDIQKYGNLVLSITKSDMDSIGAEYGDVFTVDLGDQVLEAPYCTSYSDVEIGDLVLRNDGDGIILAINMGDFASSYGIATKVSNPDKTYQWVFEEGKKLEEIGRAKYADELVSLNNIKSVMNLADSRETIEGYFKEEDFASPYYKSLYENGQVIALNMGVSFKTREFQNGLVEGLTFLSKNEGPYLVHCNEGKDRAGFTSALLSALMGLTYDEIASDYMTSYENYYHVEKGTEQYEAVKRSNIDSMLSFIAGVETKDLENVDLAAKAEEFLVAIGMEKVDIDTLKSKLSKNYK